MSKLETVKYLSDVNFPTKYQPRKWNKLKMYTNCYAYVLNLQVGDYGTQNKYYPGFFAGMDPFYEDGYEEQKLLMRFMSDLHSLGLQVKKCSRTSETNGEVQKICFMYKKDDFHFLRQDSNGFWSHKIGWKYIPTNKGVNKQKITNPERQMPGYKLIGYFFIYKNY